VRFFCFLHLRRRTMVKSHRSVTVLMGKEA
jgi:hypothetical protein